MKTSRISPFGTPVCKNLNSSGYWELSWSDPITKKRHRKQEHRLIWEETYGPIPTGYLIHHKNRNRQDNNIKNLELIALNLHFTLHLTKHGRCIQDRKAYIKEWGEKNKEHRSILAKQRRLADPQKYRRLAKESYERNKDKICEYRIKNREKQHLYMVSYYQLHKEKWQKPKNTNSSHLVLI